MNQIIDEAYNSYLKHTIIGVNTGLDRVKGYLNSCLVEYDGYYEHFTNPSFQYGYRPHTKEEFINKCKTDSEFSQRWGLKIVSRKLTNPERYKLWFSNNYQTGMEYNESNMPDFSDSYYEPTPTKLITITYNDKTIESYES